MFKVKDEADYIYIVYSIREYRNQIEFLIYNKYLKIWTWEYASRFKPIEE